MNINIFEAYADTMESNCELYRFMGEFDRITEFTVKSEKVINFYK